jgi:hypothetical protein
VVKQPLVGSAVCRASNHFVCRIEPEPRAPAAACDTVRAAVGPLSVSCLWDGWLHAVSAAMGPLSMSCLWDGWFCQRFREGWVCWSVWLCGGSSGCPQREQCYRRLGVCQVCSVDYQDHMRRLCSVAGLTRAACWLGLTCTGNISWMCTVARSMRLLPKCAGLCSVTSLGDGQLYMSQYLTRLSGVLKRWDHSSSLSVWLMGSLSCFYLFLTDHSCRVVYSARLACAGRIRFSFCALYHSQSIVYCAH